MKAMPTVPSDRQFALWHLFTLILVLAIVLALVTQLRHVGFIAAAFVVGGAAGLWRRDWRLAAACATALVIYVATYLASWLPLGHDHVMEPQLRLVTRSNLQQLEWMVQRHADELGEFPKTLKEAADHVGEPNFPLQDPWGNEFHYRRTDLGFELASFGRDGRSGGVGLDADIVVPQPGEPSTKLHRLPLRQFLFEAQGSNQLFVIATLAGIISAAIWYGVQDRERPSARRLVLSLAATTISAVIVAVFLAVFYIMASQSGH